MKLNIDALNYHVEVMGTGLPLALLHGFTGSAENWLPLINQLKEKYTVIAVDLPGHGQTDAPSDPRRYRIERCAQDLIAIFDHLGMGSLALLGYSMGGRLALYTALKFPQYFHRLILESASPGLETDPERAVRVQSDNALAERIEREGVESFVEYWENIPLFESQKTLPQDVRERLRQTRLRNNPQGLANSLRGMGTGVQPSLWSELHQLSMPALLIAGEFDTKFTGIAQRMQALIPDAELCLIKNAGHTPHLEQPGAFLTVLRG